MDILIRCELPSASGLSSDIIVNTFAVKDGDLPNQDAIDAVAMSFSRFYGSQPVGALARLRDYLSPEIARNTDVQVKAYDITGHLGGTTPVGSPVMQSNFQIGPQASASAGLPGEVAVVLTLEGTGRATAPVEAPDGGDPGSEIDRPKSRRTGRLFIGPLSVNTLASVSGVVRPDANIRDTARLAAHDLVGDLFTTTQGGSWSVWSRKDAALYPIDAFSMDNAFDTMRSRGVKATLRTRSAA